MNNLNVKKGDTVIVISGKDKGKKGKILTAMPKDSKVIVEGINIATKHQKPRNEKQAGGLLKIPTALNACKVMRVCPSCGKPTRTAYKIEDGIKVRVCKHCNETI